jgi:hypothetical protein
MAVVLFSELNLDACFEVESHGNLVGDSPKGSVSHTFGFPDGHIKATNVLKWKIVKRELLFSNCRIACRFPEQGQRGNHTCGSWIYLLPMTLYRVQLILLLCFLFKVCPVEQLIESLSGCTSNIHGLLPFLDLHLLVLLAL